MTTMTLSNIIQENYVEYARSGTVIKGQERAPVKSKYLEDIFTNNHTVRK